MKGLELPVNLVIIVAVVILVLVVVGFFFMSNSGKGISDVEAKKVFTIACTELSCGTPKDICLEAFRQGSHDAGFYDTFYSSCQTLYGSSDPLLCFSYCGGCAKLSADEKSYIVGGASGGLAPDKEEALRRCTNTP